VFVATSHVWVHIVISLMAGAFEFQIEARVSRLQNGGERAECHLSFNCNPSTSLEIQRVTFPLLASGLHDVTHL
jgi:hypothetical protein